MIRMTYHNALQYGDLDRTGDQNLIDDLDLETAVLISVLTEARTEPGDEGSEALTYKGGWWGDVASVPTDKIGSRMWLLRRAKLTTSNLNLAKTYLEECLQWMIDGGVAKTIDVKTWRGTMPVDLRWSVDITRPNNLGIWSRVWEIQLDEL